MSVVAYEDQLDADRRWALREGSMHFEQQSAVFHTLQRIVRRLDKAGIPYAVAGGMALFLHGYRRFTEVVDILVTRDGLAEIHERLGGRGFLPLFKRSKNLRDTETGVRVKFLLTGDYPGGGRPKPVAFPDPSAANDALDGIRCLRLPRLIELKLASGAAPDRLRDLADVQELIRLFRLPHDYALQLDPSVREAYADLWNRLQ